MLVGLTNQCNLLSSLGSVLDVLSLPRTAFFRWVSEVIRLCASLAGAVVADVAVALLRGLVAIQGGVRVHWGSNERFPEGRFWGQDPKSDVRHNWHQSALSQHQHTHAYL
jgi:hypothetical protein